jgi:hypothetical protein
MKRIFGRRTLVAGATLLFIWPLVLSAQTLQAPDPAILRNDQIEISYAPPRASYLRPIYQGMRDHQFLELLKQFLSPLILPPYTKLKIVTKECGEVNSWWSPGQKTLFLCYEWMEFAERVAPAGNAPDGMSREDAILGAFLQVIFHELGHAVFDIFDIPVMGREEDAADQMAGFILAQFGPEVARRTLPGAAYIWQALAVSSTWRRSTYADEHGHPLQRAYNYLCMAYGSNPEVFKHYVDQGRLPRSRAEQCPREFKQIENSFIKTLLPHIDRTKMKTVQNTQWLFRKASAIAEK